MMFAELQSVANILVEGLLNTAAEGVVFAGVVWILLRLCRQASGTRFAIWFAALVAITALPFLAGSNFLVSHFHADGTAYLRRQILLPGSWAFCLLAAWAAGAGFLLFRLLVGLWRLQAFRRNCCDVDVSTLDSDTATVLRDFSCHRRVTLCTSDAANVPAAVGFFRPAIVFPAWLLPELSADEIRLIVLHELAHLRRWDDWSNLAQKIVKALFFFHPAVWWIDRHLTLEREMACDDMVLAQTQSPRAYASSLISFAEKLHGTRGLALAQALVSRMHQMSSRLAQILDPERPQRSGLRGPMLALSSGLFALVLGAVPYMPRIVAFKGDLGLSAQQPQIAQEALNATGHSTSMTRPVAQPVSYTPMIVVRPRAIDASFHPHTPATPAHVKKAAQPRPTLVRTTRQEDVPGHPTIVILRTTQFDASGAAVWTLCVWRVGGQTMESAIFVGSI
jgi:beta-lactamase regulating signal transducer with metallopeptidase domain